MNQDQDPSMDEKVGDGRTLSRRVPVVREYIEVSGEEMDEPSFSLLHYLNVLLRSRWLIIGGTLIFCLLAIVYSKLLTPVYTANASFLPSRSQDMSSRLDASFGVGRIAPDRYTENLYLVEYYSQILTSQNFLERVAKNPLPEGSGAGLGASTLLDYYGQTGLSEDDRLFKTIETIMRSFRVVPPRQAAGRTTPMIVGLFYVDSDPRIAAAAANMILDELILFNRTEQTTKTKGNREFIENQLEETRRLLGEAEAALIKFERSNRKIVTPELQIVQGRLQRNVKLQEDIFLTLNRQLELAKIQEQENRPAIEILQRAVPPRSRTSPSFRKNTMIAGFLGLLIFCGLALGLDFVKTFDPREERTKEFLDTLQGVKGDAAKVGRLFGIKKGRGGKKPPSTKT